MHLLQHGGASLRGGAAADDGQRGALRHVPHERRANRFLELLVRVLHLRAVHVVKAANNGYVTPSAGAKRVDILRMALHRILNFLGDLFQSVFGCWKELVQSPGKR